MEIVIPSEIQASADALNADFLRVAGDVHSANVDPAFVSGFDAFADAWWSYYAEISDSYMTRLWGATQNEIDRYRAQLVTWQASLANSGAPTTGPTVAPPSSASLLGDLSGVRWLLVGAIVLAAIVVLGPRVLPVKS